MDDIYVMLGNRRLNDKKKEGNNDEAYVALVVNPKALDNTYQGFLEDCCEILSQSTVSAEQRPVYLAAREAALDNDADVTHSVVVYDRSSHQGQGFELEDRVGDTAGEYLYVSQQDIGGKIIGLQTLEMYVLADGTGGN